MLRYVLCCVVAACVLWGCQKSPSRAERLEEILKEATTQVKEAKTVEEIQKIEVDTQNKIETVTNEDSEFKLSEEETAKLGPVLNDYYQAFMIKTVELQKGIGYDAYDDSPSTMPKPIK